MRMANHSRCCRRSR